MKRKLLTIFLLTTLSLSLIGCKKNVVYTRDQDINKRMWEEEFSKNYYNKDDDDSFVILPPNFSVENVHMTDDKTISFFIADDLRHCTSWDYYNSKYKTTMLTNYYGEIKELIGRHESGIDELLDYAILMQFDAPTEFPLEEYKYLIKIEDKETEEVVYYKQIKPYEVKSQGNELKCEYALKKLKSDGFRNSKDDVSVSIKNATSTILDENYDSRKVKLEIETKIKNNSDTLLRFQNLQIVSPTLEKIELGPNINAVKPGEEATIIFSREISDSAFEMFYGENYTSDYIMYLKIGSYLNFVESNKFKKAVNDYIINK